MPEVEKKYVLTSESMAQVVAGGTMESEKISSDTYYDTAEARFGKSGVQLRKRQSGFLLSVETTVEDEEGNEVTQTREITSDAEMREILGLPAIEAGDEEAGDERTPEDIQAEFEADLEKAEIVPQAAYVTTRRTYAVGDYLTVEVDSTDFGYAIAKISVEVETEEDNEAGEEMIDEFAAEHQLEPLQQGGSKLLECLRVTNPAYYKALTGEEIEVPAGMEEVVISEANPDAE